TSTRCCEITDDTTPRSIAGAAGAAGLGVSTFAGSGASAGFAGSALAVVGSRMVATFAGGSDASTILAGAEAGAGGAFPALSGWPAFSILSACSGLAAGLSAPATRVSALVAAGVSTVASDPRPILRVGAREDDVLFATAGAGTLAAAAACFGAGVSVRAAT